MTASFARLITSALMEQCTEATALTSKGGLRVTQEVPAPRIAIARLVWAIGLCGLPVGGGRQVFIKSRV